MLVNLKLMGIAPWAEQDLTKLKHYCQAVSRATGVPIPATDDLVDRIYQRAKASDHTLSDAEIAECLSAAVKES